MHHGIQNHARRGFCSSHIRRQFHNAIRFPAQQSHRCDIIQRVTADRVFINPHERHLGCLAIVDNSRPRPSIRQIQEHPQQNDCRKPITRPPDIVPHLPVGNIRRAKHNHNSRYADGQEKVTVNRLHSFSSGAFNFSLSLSSRRSWYCLRNGLACASS